MKKIRSLLLLFFVSMATSASQLDAQQISGTWFSEDGTRQYEIREQADGLTAVLIRSSRASDKPGFAIISQLHRNGRNWEGLIHSVADSSSTKVTIRYHKKNNDKLKLKLKRMLFMDISIHWYRQDPAIAEKNAENFPPPPPPNGDF